jgi:hypothetical protein
LLERSEAQADPLDPAYGLQARGLQQYKARHIGKAGWLLSEANSILSPSVSSREGDLSDVTFG